MKSSSSTHSTRTPNHFLFMLPGTTTPAEQDNVVKAAKELTSMGYVYVASAHEKTMEDRDNIRFMPLRANDLPRFGEVAGVMIVRDEDMGRAAQEAYPGANVIVFDPSHTAPADATDEPPRPRPTAATAWQPRMLAGMVSQAA